MVKRSESLENTMVSIGRPIAPWSGLSMEPFSAPPGPFSTWTTIRSAPWIEPCQVPSGDRPLSAASTGNAERIAIAMPSTRTTRLAGRGHRFVTDRVSSGRARRDPALQTREHFPIPQNRVARLQHPVVLVREVHESRRHALGLEHAVALEPLRDRNSVVALAVDDQHGRLHLARVARGA